MLTESEIAAFERDGFVPVRAALPTDVVTACQQEIADVLRARGVDPDDAATWLSPVLRLDCPDSAAFARAGTQSALWSAYSQLLGPDSWWRREGVGGTIPVRFPSADDPGDAGWHIEGSFDVDGEYWVNLRSKGRGLLVIFLLSDVSELDAPTQLKVGSHLDIPKLLEPFGDTGASFTDVAKDLPARTFERPSAFATGRAGDVFICHPFLVHRATWPHRGAHPRAIAQPAVAILEPFRLEESWHGQSSARSSLVFGNGKPRLTPHATRLCRRRRGLAHAQDRVDDDVLALYVMEIDDVERAREAADQSTHPIDVEHPRIMALVIGEDVSAELVLDLRAGG